MHQQAAEASAYYGGVPIKSYDRYKLSGKPVGMSYRESVKHTEESVRVRTLADFDFLLHGKKTNALYRHG